MVLHPVSFEELGHKCGVITPVSAPFYGSELHHMLDASEGKGDNLGKL